MFCVRIKLLMLETKKAALNFLKILPKIKDKKRATVIGLYGNLGAGKTTFTQFVAKELGVSRTIISPTFVIERIYGLNKKGVPFKKLIHIDAYRLDNPEELLVLGFKEILKDKNNLILIEWADKVFEILPKDHFKIFFSFSKQKNKIKESREIFYGK